jgi:hypothetical protein
LQLKAPAKDWSGEIFRNVQRQQERARQAQQRLLAERATGTKPSLPLERYAGTYADSMYGEVQVRSEGGGLRISMGPLFDGRLEHWHYDTFRANWERRHQGRSFVTFSLNARGQVDGLAVDAGGGALEFRRVPDRPARAAGQGR